MEIYRQYGEPGRFSHKRYTRSKFGEFTVVDGAELSQRNTNCRFTKTGPYHPGRMRPRSPNTSHCCATAVTTPQGLRSARAPRFSNWWSLIRSLANLIVKIKAFKERKSQAGFWVIGAHRMVVISSCVICRKLRGRMLQQHMADHPEERTNPSPPFTCVGFDVFGPWQICTGKLSGAAANSKRWGLILTCLNSRAIHMEVLEAMDASAFICAL